MSARLCSRPRALAPPALLILPERLASCAQSQRLSSSHFPWKVRFELARTLRAASRDQTSFVFHCRPTRRLVFSRLACAVITMTSIAGVRGGVQTPTSTLNHFRALSLRDAITQAQSMATSDAGEPKLLRAVFGHLSKVLNESNTASLMEEAAGIMKLREVLRAAAVPGERLLSTIESVLLLLRSMGRFRSPQAGGGAHGPRAAPSAPDGGAHGPRAAPCHFCQFEDL